MRMYNETECLSAIERVWGEVESYNWLGDWNCETEPDSYKNVIVTLTAEAAEAAANRINSSPLNKLLKKKMTADEVRIRQFHAEDIAKMLGNCAMGTDYMVNEYGVACFVDDGIMVFDSADEYETWANQV